MSDVAFWLLFAALCVSIAIVAFYAGFAFALSRERRGGYVAGPFTGGRR